MTLYSLNPVTDARWRDFIQRDPRSSIFHTPEWLDALARTYNYEAIAYTTSPSGKEIKSAQVFCDVNSWVTGRRLVSLPFSDHTAPLAENQTDLHEILSFLQQKVDRKIYKYVEIRPLDSTGRDCAEPFAGSKRFYFHRLSLTGDLQSLFRSFHVTSVRQRIRRAEREKLDYTEGRSDKLVEQFYRMLLHNRRKHGLPPQPISWFRNLAASLGSNLKIRLASRNGTPICGIITLTHKRSMVYKYGCSDPRQHRLGGMAFLLWKAIQEAKDRGLQELDMGRTDCDNTGLIDFKEHWGANRTLLTYLRYPAHSPVTSGDSWQFKMARRVLGMVPTPTLATAGKLLYRHVG